MNNIVVNAMSIRWPRVLTPTQLSQLIRSQKSPLKAFGVFNEAKAKYPNYHHNGPAYATMINVLASSGRTAEMKQVIDQMRKDSCECKDSVFASVIKTYAKSGSTNEAITLFESLRQFNCVSWTESFNTLLEIMVKESKFETACRLFLENSHGWEVKSRTRSLTLLIDALCRIGQSDLALWVFQEMDYQSCYPNRETYRILMRGLCEDGKLNEATHLLYSMFWRISQKGSGGDVAIYRILLDALCDNGQVEEAMEMLGKILRKGLKAPKRCLKQLDLSQCYHRGEIDVESAKILINRALIKGGVPSSESYTTMAVDLFSEGKINEGNKVLEEMHDRGFRTVPLIYEGKVAALFRQGKVDEAVEVIDKEMMEENCVPTVRLYNIVIKGLCDVKRSPEAGRYLRKMCRQVGCVPDKETYAILVDGLCHEGKYIEASHMLEEMSVKSYRPSAETYNAIIQGLCLMERPYVAVMWLEEMISQAKIPELSVWDSLVSSVCSRAVLTELLYERLERLRNSS